MKFKILNTQPTHYPQSSKEALAQVAFFDEREVVQKDLSSAVDGYDIILTGLGLTWNKEVLTHAKNLKLLVTATTGLDHIDLDYLKEHNISLISLKGERALLDSVTSTSELAFGLLLSLVRQIPTAFEHVKQGGWERERYKGHELSGKTMGIVGYGRLGKIMSKQARGFSMNVLAVDPFRTEEEVKNDGVKLVSLDELLVQSDVVSLHVPLEESTVHLIGERELGLMKKDAYIINTARGKLIDEVALLDALRNKIIAGAGLDVLSSETEFFVTANEPCFSPLVEYAKNNANCIIVPHVGGTTFEAIYKTRIFLTKKVITFIESYDIS